VRFLSLSFTLGTSHSLVRNTRRGFLFVCENDVGATLKGEWPVRLDVKTSLGVDEKEVTSDYQMSDLW
jgi:hypothetical protein